MISYERFKELCESIGLKEKVFSPTFKIFIFPIKDGCTKECAVYHAHWGMRVCSILEESNIGCWEHEECELLPRFEMLKEEIRQIKMKYKMDEIEKDFV